MYHAIKREPTTTREVAMRAGRINHFMISIHLHMLFVHWFEVGLADSWSSRLAPHSSSESSYMEAMSAADQDTA